jgi:apolipoprotein N-acyltransferase
MLPFVCYEIIFPGEARTSGGTRPGWMLNLTNDGWFGISTGPYQHLRQARVRTIEQGLPLVRAANTGISAVIDPVGRIVKLLPLGAEGVMDASLPRRIEPPLYARTGDAGAALVMGAALIIIIRRRMRRA